jgi:A/G-specific adenine glycosylase
MLVLLHAGEVMLEKRVASGIWGGLWSLPELEPGTDIPAACAGRYGAEIATLEPLPAFAHTFTHFRLDIEPHKAAVARVLPHASAPGVVWLPLNEAIGAAIPAPVRRILAALSDSVHR